MAPLDRFRTAIFNAWNSFQTHEEVVAKETPAPYYGSPSFGNTQPGTRRLTFAAEKTFLSSIYTRLSIDVAQVLIRHARLEDDAFLEEMPSALNYCLKKSANIDQEARAFRQDVVMTMLDKGYAAIVPVDTTANPMVTASYDINTMRVGEITDWYPRWVKIALYNDRPDRGKREEIVLPKTMVATVTNPFFHVMNGPNSTLQRLSRKLALLDRIDEEMGADKLNLLIQLPYSVRSETKAQHAEKRRSEIELQLRSNKYGIAYIDGTEKVTQLNRPLENNLLQEIEYLGRLLYSQLGLTEAIMDGTASESVQLNYENRTVVPIVTAICEAMERAFLSKTAIAQGQGIVYYKDPFRYVPLGQMADVVDKLTRNEVMSSNEIRTRVIGIKPSKDPKADELRNSNMPESKNPTPADAEGV